MVVKTDRLRALKALEATVAAPAEPPAVVEPEPLPLLNFDEEQVRAERLAREQAKREQTEPAGAPQPRHLRPLDRTRRRIRPAGHRRRRIAHR